jgi:aminoglycoside phosphotransferase (APT) family kinase protein
VRGLARELTSACRTTPPPVLVHGDLAPWHLICGDDGEIRAVLDFMGPRIADPAMDFGRLVQHWGENFARSVLSHYSLTTDANFAPRMVLYAQFEPLNTVLVAAERGLPEWVAWGKRRLAAAAAAASRKGSSRP